MILRPDDNSSASQDKADPVRRIVEALSEQDQLLIICNYELYEGRWDLLRADLADRLAGRPYVLKLGERIKEDLERAAQLEELERKFDIKLCDYVAL